MYSMYPKVYETNCNIISDLFTAHGSGGRRVGMGVGIGMGGGEGVVGVVRMGVFFLMKRSILKREVASYYPADIWPKTPACYMSVEIACKYYIYFDM